MALYPEADIVAIDVPLNLWLTHT